MGIDEGSISGGLTHPNPVGTEAEIPGYASKSRHGVKEPPRSITLEDQMKSKIVRSEDSMRKAGSLDHTRDARSQ